MKTISTDFIEVLGTVFSGKGEGEFYVNLYSKNIQRVLGLTPFPGTLNIRLEPNSTQIIKELLSKPIYIIEPPIKGYGRVYAWPGFIKCTKVYIIRPEKTVYSLDVIEVIAKENLRKLFGLKDGDLVRILISLRKGALPQYCF